MEQILSGCEGCLVYIDDILIHGPTKEIHDKRLFALLKRLKERNVTLNKDKCQFGLPEIEFLGHILTPKGIRPARDKVMAIKLFRDPQTPEEVRSFLGLVNYVGKFIPNLATITAPLRQLTHQNTVFTWDKTHQEAFNQLKHHLTQESKLGYYNVNDRTQIVADASPIGLGAVLIQFNDSGPRIITYASRSLSLTEQKYAQTEKEALALVWGVERFHYYIYGKEFELVTDHKPLEVIFAPKSKPCCRIERWVLRLQSYKFTVIYRPGKTNIADPLSRLVEWSKLKENNPNSTHSNQYVNWIVTHMEPKAIKLEDIAKASSSDHKIQAVKEGIYKGIWLEVVSQYKTIETELCFADEILLRGTRIILPESLQERALYLGHEGHPGITVMKRRLRAKVWWPKMDLQIEQFVKKCKGCTLVGAPTAPEPIRRTELPSRPWQHIAIDFCGPLPSGHHLFVIVDYFSRFVEVEIMTKIDSARAIEKLKVIFARFGFPLSITADNGRQFISQEFKHFCETNNITLNTTIPYWPQQNGEVERQNRSLIKRLAISQEAKRDWAQDLLEYLIMYRSTPHSTTLKTPSELMYGWNIRDKLPSIYQPKEMDEELHDRDKEVKQKGKSYADMKRHAKPNDVKVGDRVLLKRQILTNKLSTTFEPTIFKVIERNGSEVLVENTETNTQYRRNVAHTKRVSDETTIDTEPDQDDVPCPQDEGIPKSTEPDQNDIPCPQNQAIPNSPLQASTPKRTRPPTPDQAEAVPAKRIRTRPSRFNDYTI